ncbi:MAG: T9SS type A sorting domain-containing protein, partial [Chitinophagales bacterium]
TIGGNNNDFLYSIQQTIDGGYILGGYSYSPISGDKTEGNMGAGSSFADYWVVKLEGPGCIPTTELCNSLDDNCNGLIDDGITETISIAAGGPTTFCQGGNVLLTATYSGVSVQWKKDGANIPGATSSTYSANKKATYTCVTTSPCGTATSTGIFVNVQKNPPASITAGGATTFCAGGSVVLTANAGGGLSYQWYKGAIAIGGATSINYTATTTGNYKCRVTKTATGCFKNSNVIAVSVPCKEGELINSENSFSIYPNPNNGTFKIIYESSIGATSPLEGRMRGVTIIEIYNSLGQLIYSQYLISSEQTIDISNQPSGVYLVKVCAASSGMDGSFSTQEKIIIE